VNIHEYISSGIVESYVLGLADDAERAEFERMCLLHPEVRAAREAFEISVEKQARTSRLEPPAALKSKILSTIEMEYSAKSDRRSGNTPPPPYMGVARDGQNNDGLSKLKVRRMPLGLQKLIAVAAVVLLVLSTALNFYFFNRYREYNQRYQELLASQTQLVQHNQVLQTRMLDYEKAVEMMKDPGMAIVRMPAMPSAPDPNSATIVYWDTTTKDVYLAVSKLPTPSVNEQYQLWAMVDGKPVDAGVFDLNAGPGMFKMKNIPRAEAFAITLEKKGGSPTPSLDKLYVLGKV
jgi:anti-sigma-K factor RskA